MSNHVNKHHWFQARPVIVMVTGGRDYNDVRVVERILEEFVPSGALLLHGGCRSGADAIADSWARNNLVHVLKCDALFKQLGPKAGPIRNAAMLSLYPNAVIAFPGGEGTSDAVRQARARGIEVLEIAEDGTHAERWSIATS